MKNTTTTILLVLTGIVVSVIVYKELKGKKSFLDMTDAEKKKLVADETATRMAIRNNPNLTQQEKIEAEEKLNKQNLEKFTLEEQKAMADYNVKNLMAGNTQLLSGSVDASMGLGNVSTGIVQSSVALQNIKNMDFSNYNFENVDWSKFKI